MSNVIVRPKIYEQFRRVIRGERLLLVGGTVQREGHVVNLLADWLAPLEAG